MLATTLVGPHGSTQIFGGNSVLWNQLGHAVAANATFIPDSDGSYRRIQYSFQGLETFPTAIAAQVLGTKVSPRAFGGGTTPVPIDFAGPSGTVRFLSYWKAFTGRFPSSLIRGRTVIIGETAAIGQDVHATPMSGGLMSGTEIVADAAATIAHGIPLRFGAGWVNVLLIVLLGAMAPLLGLAAGLCGHWAGGCWPVCSTRSPHNCCSTLVGSSRWSTPSSRCWSGPSARWR